MRSWTLLGVAGGLLLSASSAMAVPLATAPCGSRASCDQRPRPRERALLDQLVELERRARNERSTLQRLHDATVENLRRTQGAVAGALPWRPPEGMRAELATASLLATAPRATGVTVVPPDEFYLQMAIAYPAGWVAERREVTLRWTLFDQRHLPDGSTPRLGKAVYSEQGYRQPITARHLRYTQRVSGLGLLPGRYFISAHVLAPGARTPASVLSLGAFRVVQPPAPGVRVLLPHHPGWYQRDDAIKLGPSRVLARGRTLQLTTSLERSRSRTAPLYLEVVAESGFHKVALYRARQPQRRARERVRLLLRHTLPSGPYQLRLTAYAEAPAPGPLLASRGRRGPGHRGIYDFQRIPVTIGAAPPVPADARSRESRSKLDEQIDRRLLGYLREQVGASNFRHRLRVLQAAWKSLWGGRGSSRPSRAVSPPGSSPVLPP